MGDDQTRPDVGVEPDQRPGSTPPEPVSVGRYELMDRIGSGGMGVVYTARDRELGRTVALKILKSDVAAQTSSKGRERLIVEARAIAKLAHPNVIGVYEVGTHDGRLFMACEYVEGEPLDRWLKRARSRTETLEVFVACARGLAAAHAAGIVHRDFKPSNAIIGNDGRVRVLDFGLARSLESVEATRPGEVSDDGLDGQRDGGLLDGGLTRTGAVMGTPAYMSPEQVRGRKVGPASDQFSFCIALAEALTGKRPFAHTEEQPVLQAIASDAPELELQGQLTARLRRIIRRGLQKEPGERFESMQALIRALEGVLTPRWPKFAVGGGAIAAVAFGAFFALNNAPQAGGGCRSGAELMEQVWSDATRNAVNDAFHKTGLQYADATAETIVGQMDRWSSTWEAAYDEACETGDQAAAQRLCLETQLAQLDGLVHVFERSNRSTVAGAGPSVARLPDPSSCADPLYTELPAPPEGQNDAVQELRLQLALAKAQVIALELGRGITSLERLDAEAAKLDYAPLSAEVQLELAVAYFKAGRMEDAEKVLLRAMEVAEGVGHVVVRAEAWLWSMQIQGSVHRRFDEALRMSHPARAAIERCGEGHVRLRIRLEALLSEVLRLKGDYEESEAAARKALELAREHRGKDSLETSLAYRSLALVLRERGQFEEALKFAEQSVGVNERVLGPDHPETAGSLGDVATILSYTDEEPERTLALWKRAHAIHETAYPPGHRNQAISAHGIATTLYTLDRSEEAIAYFEQALEVDAANEGEDHPASVPTMYGLAMALIELDRFDDGRAHLERAHRIILPVIGKDHPDLSYTLAGLGLLEYLSGDAEAGRAHFEHARTNLLAKFEPNSSRLHKLDLDWAEAALRAGLFEEADERLGHARTIADAEGTSDVDRGRSQWLSAQVYGGQGDHAAARESATRALELDPALRDEVEPWLAELK